MRRAPWGTEDISYSRPKSPNILSMRVTLWERCCGTAPHSLNWYIQRISLDSYTAKIGGSSVWEGFDYYPQESFQIISYFWYSLLISKEVTPIILRQFDSCIVHHRPRCHLITFGSHCSVISILNPPTGNSVKNLFWVSWPPDSILLEER